MPMMAKMRSLAPAFIITVGALFVLFMVISDSNVLEAIGGPVKYVAKVNGREITFQEFQNALDRQIENYKQQNKQDPTDEQIEQFREQVWESLINQALIEELIEKFNLVVSDQEVKDIILGENPPDFLKQNFIDSLGNFNRQLYEQALFDPQNKQALIQAEEFVRQSRLTQKLQSILLASINVGEDEVRRRYIDQFTNIEADYILLDVNSIPDTEIKITDQDLKNYYEKNLNLYKQPPQRKLKFVLFPNVASIDDTISVIKNLENVLRKAKEDTSDFKGLVEIYSELPYSRDTLNVQSFNSESLELIKKAKPGDLIGPVATPQGYTIFKYFGTVTTDQQFVRASHILINQFGSDQKNLEEANKIYERLIKGEDFAKLAAQYSADLGSAKNGGDLNYFSKGMMVKEFEEACFKGKINEIQKPIKSSFGYHLIKVTDKTNNKYIVERIVNQVKQSATTRDKIFNSANDFSYLANKNGFEKEAKMMNYEIKETPLFSEESISVPAIGPNKRLVKWSFENSVGTVSQPFKVPMGYVVVKIVEATKERFTPFEEVKEAMKPAVIREKKFEKIEKTAKDVFKKLNGNITNISSIRPDLVINNTGSFTPNGFIPNLGRDYLFINRALGSEVGKLIEPFKGMRGWYIMVVKSRSPFDKDNYLTQSRSLREQILNEKKSRFFNELLTRLKDEAEIVDNRHLFFN